MVERLLSEQLGDGGWNCEAENGSLRSSFATTINVLEGRLAHERATGSSSKFFAARRRGEKYLLKRKLFRRKSTGEVVHSSWLQFSFPARWHYDVLRGLEYFALGWDVPDARMDEAIDLLRSKKHHDGTWWLETRIRAWSILSQKMAIISLADGIRFGRSVFSAGMKHLSSEPRFRSASLWRDGFH